MAEVGVLNLTIHDNSSQAAEGLNTLADALFRVKRAVGSELNLSTVATQIKKIAETVNNNINQTTISSLKEFGDAMARLKGFGNVNIKVGGGNNVQSAMESIKTAQSSVKSMNTEFQEINQRVSGVKSDLDNFKSAPALKETSEEAKTATESVSKLNDYVQRLMDRLNHPANSSYKGFRDIVDFQAGVSKNYTSIAEASGKTFIENIERIDSFIDKLNNPESTEKWSSEAFDKILGIVEENKSLINETNSMFNVPATESNSPFAYATDEIEHYRELIALATKDFEWWSQEYDRVAKRIKYNGATEERTNELANAENSMQFNVDKIDEYEAAIERIKTAMTSYADSAQKAAQSSSNLGQAAETAEEFADALDAVRSAASASSEYNEAIEFARQWNESVPGAARAAAAQAAAEAQEAARAVAEAQEAQETQADISWIDNLTESATQIDLLNMRIDSMVSRLHEGATAGNMTGEQIAHLVEQIQAAREELDQLTSSAFSLNGAWKSMKSGIQSMFPTLTGLVKRLKNVATMRALRYAIRQITSGISEGIKNMYYYSQEAGTSFAPALDTAKSSLDQFKNSIGAAASPLLTSLVPAIQTLVSWLITAVNYLNQFFSLLSGSTTWTKAVYNQASAYDDVKKSASGASDATKDLLADWDELNIIQSSSGGGGGSGTGTTTDYSSMFEEMDEFSDTVKDIINFIEDHLGGIEGLAKKIAAIILGWKISKAFSGVLGQLGELVAGGALLVLGVELAYGGGFEAGTKGYFDTGDLIATIGGWLASAIGGSLITSALGFGSNVGLYIGLGVGIVATLVGYLEGQADMFDRLRWGNKEMTPEQIESYVKSRFSFDVEAEITVLDSNISNREQAKSDLETEVNKFTKNLNIAKIKVGIEADDAEQAVKDAYESAQTALTQVQSYIDTNHDALITTFSISPPKDSTGKDITEDIISTLTIGEKTLKQYFMDMGAELARAMDEGERNEWKNGEMENVLALMEHQRNILSMAEQMQQELTFEMNYKFNLNNLTQDNAKKIFEQEEQEIEAYKEKFMKDRETAREAAIKELSWTEAAIADYTAQGKDTAELEKLAQTYRDLIIDYLDPEKAEEAWNDKLSESMANMRRDWIDALQEAGYGIAEAETYQQSTFLQSIGGYKSPGTNLADDLYNAAKAYDPVGDATNALNQYFDVIKKEQPDYVQAMMDTLNLNVWDIASDTIKANLVKVLRESLGDDFASMVLQNIGVSLDEVEKLIGGGYTFEPDFIVDAKSMTQEAEEMRRAIAGVNDELGSDELKNAGATMKEIGAEFFFAADGADEVKDATKDISQTTIVPPTEFVLDTGDSAKDAVETAKKEVTDAAKQTDPINLEIPAAISLAANTLVTENVTKTTLEDAMEEIFSDSNANLLKRPVLDFGDHVETLLSETYTAGPNGEGLEWTESLVINFTPILSNGEKLSQESLDEYVEGLLKENGDIKGVVEADKPENGGLGLYLGSETGFMDDYTGAIDRATEAMEDLHEMQAEVYGYADEGFNVGKDDPIDEIREAVATSDPVEVTAEVKVDTIFIDEVREAIEYAVSNADVDLADSVNVENLANKLYGQFGAYYNVEDIKSYINQLVEQQIGSNSASLGGKLLGVVGSTVQEGGYGRNINKINSGDTTSDEDVIDYNQMTASVKNGTQSANTSMVSELQVIASRLQALLNKNWTVNISPSSTLGSVNAKSGTAWNKVTGDMV